MGSVYLKFWPSESKYESLSKMSVYPSLHETSGYEHLMVGNLAFLQVSLCGISTSSFIGIC
jgi:hypothetical protein